MNKNKYFLLIILSIFLSCDTSTITIPPQDQGPILESLTASAPDENSIVKLTFLFKEDMQNLKEQDIHLSADFPFITVKDSFNQPDKSNFNKYEIDIIPGSSGFLRAMISPYTFTGWSVGSVEVAAVYDFEIFYNAVKNNYEILIDNYNKKGGVVVIPQKFDNYPVTMILPGAFSNCEITDVSIPDSVVTIESFAFTGNKLIGITIPDSITSISPFTFYGNQISAITIPDNVTSIGISAFGNNQLTSIVIPESVILLSGFDNNKLSSIEIPNKVRTIGEDAFENNHLQEVKFAANSSLTGIENYAFACNQLEEIEIPESVTGIGNYAFAYNYLTEVEIPSKISILSGFNDNLLTEVEIPDSVTRLGAYAFANNQIDEIEIPKSVTNIGLNAFANNKLSVLTFENDTRLTLIDEGAFQNNLFEEIDIPANITINRQAFTGNQLLKITIGDDVILNGIVFGNGFENTYDNKKEGGVYTRPNTTTNIWTKQP